MSALLSIANGHIQDGPWLEFGVSSGGTLRQLAAHAPVIYGFDWFEGLPEDMRDEAGNLQDPKGKFKANLPAELPSNCFLVVGLFEDTLPAFLKHRPGPFGLVHIDCDLYSSTKFVLDQLGPYLDGVVIAFDEIRGFPAGEYHEGRAWNEFLAKGIYSARLLGYQHTAGAIYQLRKNAGPMLTNAH